MLQNSSSVEVFKGSFGFRAYPRQVAHERHPAFTWAPAKQAYVVMASWSAGKRLILITRGEGHAYRVVTSPDTTSMTLKALRSLASKLNRKMGIPLSAAKVLAVDWNNNFSTPPTLMAAYSSGQRICRLGRRGRPNSKGASSGWLRMMLHLHYWIPEGEVMSPHSERFAELAAFYESVSWAEAQGRTTMEGMLPTERAAAGFVRAGQALRNFSEGYRRKYSRWFDEFYREHGDDRHLATMQRENRSERRKALLSIRAGRALLLKAYIQARRDYVVARSEIFVPAGVIPIQ